MQPGRELDALIAEKIFKKKVTWEASFVDDNKADVYFLNEDDEETFTLLDVVPVYSTHIAPAWEVVEEMEKKGSFIKLHNCEETGKWLCIITHPDEPCLERHALQNTAPHAICLAALSITEELL